MDVAQVLIAIVGLGAAVTTYCLMRFPHMRRERFRHYGAFSIAVSVLGAPAVLLLCLALRILQKAGRVGGREGQFMPLILGTIANRPVPK